MKVGFTVNLGNYESMRIESSEYDHLEDCLEEIWMALHATQAVEEPAVKRFLERPLWQPVKTSILKDAEREVREDPL